MDEVEIFTGAEALQIATHFIAIKFRLECEQSFQAKDRVIKIAAPGAVFESAVLVLLRVIKAADEIGRIAQQFRREPRDLQHLKAQAHALVDDLRFAAIWKQRNVDQCRASLRNSSSCWSNILSACRCASAGSTNRGAGHSTLSERANSTTAALSRTGKALICSMISCALTPVR